MKRINIRKFVAAWKHDRKMMKYHKKQGLELTPACRFPNLRYAWRIATRKIDSRQLINDLPLYKDTVQSNEIKEDIVIPNFLKKNDQKPIYRQEPIEIPELEKLENGKPPSSGIYIPHHEGTEYIVNEQYNNSWVRDNGYRYMVTKYGTPIMLCRNEEDALEIANNTENYGLGLSVTDLEKI